MIGEIGVQCIYVCICKCVFVRKMTGFYILVTDINRRVLMCLGK